MSRVICEMARAVLSDGNTDTVARTIDFIRENFARPITNRDIASNVNYHEFYVNKLIKRQTGMTLHRYLTAIRVQEAKRAAHLDLRACVEDRGVLRIRIGRVLHIRVRKGDRRHAERIQTSPRRARLIRNTISTSKGSSKRSQENNNDQTASALENKLEKSHRAPLHVRRSYIPRPISSAGAAPLTAFCALTGYQSL